MGFEPAGPGFEPPCLTDSPQAPFPFIEVSLSLCLGELSLPNTQLLFQQLWVEKDLASQLEDGCIGGSF